jgi:hypothetical protein
MKTLLLLVLLLFFSYSFSQKNIVLKPKELYTTYYDSVSVVKDKKNLDTTFLIEITDTSVILSTLYPRKSVVTYKITEEIFSSVDVKILKCKTSENKELTICYYDVTKEFDFIWVTINFIEVDFAYKVFN